MSDVVNRLEQAATGWLLTGGMITVTVAGAARKAHGVAVTTRRGARAR